MNILRSYHELGEFAGKARYANMLMAADSQDDDSIMLFQRLSLTESVSNEFLRNAISALGKPDNEPVFRGYDPGYKPSSHEVCYIRLAEHEPVAAMLDTVSDIERAEIFKEADDVIDRLRFYAIILEDKSRHSVFLRRYTRKKELTRSRWTALMSKGDQYDRVKRKIFLFDDQFDCFSWDGYLFIEDVPNFQKIFRYFEELVAKGEKAIEYVTSRVPIKNVDEFVTGCKADSRMLARLAQIVRKPYFKTITMADIKRTIKEFDVDAKIVVEAGKEKLLFERGPSKRWTILDLLDDNYLKSSMTNTKYESNSKVAL